MATSVNKVRNPRLARGRELPQHWTLDPVARGVTCVWEEPSPGERVMTLRAARRVVSAGWVQTIACRAKTWCRIEATISCDLTCEPDGGCVLTVEDPREGRDRQAPKSTPPIRRSTVPVTVRVYYRTAPGQKSLTVRVGLRQAFGRLRVHEVRASWILEPEAVAHPLSIPPPPLAYPAPRVAQRVCVVSATAEDRPLTGRLRRALGAEAVETVAPAGFRPSALEADAVLMLDASAPSSVGSLAALKKLSDTAVVVISLPAFARLAGPAVRLRHVEQEDDPIHARVDFACHATRGFALHDQFPFAWPGGTGGSFAQNHMRRTKELKAFLAKHGLVTLLVSMCNEDVTSERPVALYRATPRGGLFVVDLDPLEAVPSTQAEPACGWHLLLSILGRDQHGLGQYAVPVDGAVRCREHIRELCARFAEIRPVEDDVPLNLVRRQLLVLGHEDTGFGLPLAPRPVVLVRSGLRDGDFESFYGSLAWFKQLVRMEPHQCPYIRPLASRFRLAWEPLVADWSVGNGFARSGSEVDAALHEGVDGLPIELLLDVVSRRGSHLRIVLPGNGGPSARYASWLPALWPRFSADRYFTFAPRAEDSTDRDSYEWGWQSPVPLILLDPEAFRGSGYREAIERGATVARIEVPARDEDFPARSIGVTDLVATLIEHVVGMHYGLIAVNRRPTPVHLAPFPPVAPGEALVVPREDAVLKTGWVRAG